MRRSGGTVRGQEGIVRGRAVGWGEASGWGNHPGSTGSLRGLKQAFDSSRKASRALPPSSVPKRKRRDRVGAIGARCVTRALSNLGQCKMTCSTVCGFTPHSGQWVALRGWKRAVYEPTKAWPVMRRTRVAEAVREPPAAPTMTGGSFPEGGEGRARNA